MLRTIFSGLLLIIVLATYGQQVTILDEESRQPIVGALLFSERSSTTMVTGEAGKADISVFQKDEPIIIRALGYETMQTTPAELDNSTFELLLTPALYNLDQVIVSATKWAQSSDNIPTKIISVSPQEVALQNPQTAADLLGVSGKVYIQKSQQGGGSPMIRGFATNRLIYTIDGVRMNTAIFRGGNIQNVISLDPFATQNTEVLFGPGSVIYGSDAIGGVMSFETLNPALSQTGSTTVSGKVISRYSTANKEKTGHLDIRLGGNKWASVTSVSYWDFDNLRQGRNGPDDYLKTQYVERQNGVDVVIDQKNKLLQIPSAYSQLNLMQKIRFKPNEAWDFNYGFHFSQTSDYGRYDRHTRYRNGLPRYAEWNYGPQLWQMNLLSATNTSKNAAYDQLAIRLAQQRFEESRIDRTLNRDTRSIREERVDAYSLNLDFTKIIDPKHRIFYGAEYVINDVTSSGTDEDVSTGISVEGPSRYPQATWQSLGIYVNDEFKVAERTTLQAGVRYSQFLIDAEFDTTFYPFPFTTATINQGALTGSFGAVFRPTSTLVINTNLGTAFRAPNVDDLGKIFDSEPGAVVVPNPDLKAEYAYNADLGFTRIIDEHVKVDMTAYYTLLENALVRRNDLLDGQDSILYDGELSKVQSIQNAAMAKVYGLQAGLEIKFPAGLTFMSDINFQKGEEELADGTTSPSRHAAPLFGVSRLRYKNGPLIVEVNSQYQGSRSSDQLAVEEQGKDEIYAKDANGNNYSPGWYTLNLKSSYQFAQAVTLNLGLENITDQRYRPYSSGISGAGRNMVFSLRWDF